MLYGLLQIAVLALALGYALWQFWGRLAPQSRAWSQQKLALALMAPACPAALNRLGWHLLPRVASSCGSGCHACGVCEGA